MGRSITTEYLATRNPEAVVISGRLFGSVEAATKGVGIKIEAAPKGHWSREFYGTLISPQSDYRVCIMKINEKVYYPLLLKRNLPNLDTICSPTEGTSNSPSYN